MSLIGHYPDWMETEEGESMTPEIKPLDEQGLAEFREFDEYPVRDMDEQDALAEYQKWSPRLLATIAQLQERVRQLEEALRTVDCRAAGEKP